MAAKLTEKSIQRLSAKKQRDVCDGGAIGLSLRVATSGRKVWRYRYQLRGKTQIMTLGEWPDVSLTDARALAGQYRSAVVAGENPAAQHQREQSAKREMPTVAEFIPEYIARHAKPNKMSWKADELILQKWIEPRIGLLRMDEVTRRDIVRILDECRDEGNVRQPGKVLAVTRMLFKVAIQRGVLDATPCIYITESQPAPAKQAMTREEIRQWWGATGEAIDSANPSIPIPVALALRLLLLTGQRPGEIAAITRDELHLDSEYGPFLLIKGERRRKGRAKGGKPHAVALEPLAIEVVEQALELSGSDYLFEKPSGGPVRVDSGLGDAVESIYSKHPRPTPKAARHTVATELAELGVDEYHVGRVLGHASKTVTGTVYINSRVNEAALRNQRNLLSSWEARLREFVQPEDEDSKVVRIGG